MKTNQYKNTDFNISVNLTGLTTETDEYKLYFNTFFC